MIKISNLAFAVSIFSINKKGCTDKQTGRWADSRTNRQITDIQADRHWNKDNVLLPALRGSPWWNFIRWLGVKTELYKQICIFINVFLLYLTRCKYHLSKKKGHVEKCKTDLGRKKQIGITEQADPLETTFVYPTQKKRFGNKYIFINVLVF